MRKLAISCAVATLMALAASSEAVPPEPRQNEDEAPPREAKQPPPYEVGVASWYGEECQGNLTASGEIYDMNGLTAAHNQLPLGTWIKVTNLKNNRSLILRINDRGPGIPGRLLDVSLEAARRLGFVSAGLTHVQIEVLVSLASVELRKPYRQIFRSPSSVPRPLSTAS
jgi:rare lipoprotein A